MTVLELLQEYQIPTVEGGHHRNVRPGYTGFDCPHCLSGKYHAHYSPEYNTMFCWQCGRLPLLNTLSALVNLPWWKIKELLDPFTKEEIEDRPRGKLILPKGLGHMLPAHRHYLKGRGFDPDELERTWGLQGIGMAAKLCWRIFIPIYHYGKMVSWTTRSISDQGQSKYVTAKPEEEALPAKSVLFGADHCGHTVLVVEGPVDAMKLGFGAVATLGVGYTRSQLLAISRYPSRVIIYDSEVKAQEKARELCEELQCFPGKTMRVEIDSKDPGSASRREIRLLRKSFLGE